jgi:hypothetical protein
MKNNNLFFLKENRSIVDLTVARPSTESLITFSFPTMTWVVSGLVRISLLDTTCSVCHIRYALKYSRLHFLATNYANFPGKKAYEAE